MPTFVALLRGINVGKAKRVPMAELRAILTGLGHSSVATLLNSGNAVFKSSAGKASARTACTHAAAIAAAISDKLKFEVPVIVKSATELAEIIAENPLMEHVADASRLLVVFVQDAKALTELRIIERLIVPPERFVIGAGAAYLHCALGILESKAGAALLAKAGKSVTTRNWATVLKLQALVADAG